MNVVYLSVLIVVHNIIKDFTYKRSNISRIGDGIRCLKLYLLYLCYLLYLLCQYHTQPVVEETNDVADSQNAVLCEPK